MKDNQPITAAPAAVLAMNGTHTQVLAHMAQGGNILFCDFAVTWFFYKKKNLRPKTYEDYKGLFLNHVQPYFRGIKLMHVTGPMLEYFFESLPLGSATANKIKASIVLPILRKAYFQGLIPRDPTVGLEPIRVANVHHEVYTHEEIERLTAVSASSYWRIAFPLLVATGLRRAELLGLEWNDFDSEKRTLHVQRDYISTSHGCMITETKTIGSNRYVAIPASLCAAMEDYHLHEGKGKTYIISQIKADKPVDPQNFSRTYRSWCKKANIPKNKWGGHCARATYCTMAGDICDLDGIRRQVGHSDFRMLSKVYLRDKINHKQYDVADAMGRKLSHILSSSK